MSIIKKIAPKMIFLNEKKNQKDSDDFRHRKLTLNVRILQTADGQK